MFNPLVQGILCIVILVVIAFLIRSALKEGRVWRSYKKDGFMHKAFSTRADRSWDYWATILMYVLAALFSAYCGYTSLLAWSNSR